ncbi:MAG: DedA family protein [Prevotellaceae bacterium]|nr:DedA family protein [Prevotellaceae bacterium]
MLDFFYHLAEQLDYFYVTLLMAVESSFIPFPSEIVVPPAAYMAAEGSMNVWLVIVFATLGSLIGATVNYALSYYVGRPIVYRFAESRLGRLCLLNKEKIEKAEAYFDKRGAAATLVGRLVPAVRQLISIPAGLAKMNFAKFALYTAIGAGAWNAVLAALGYYLHSVVPKEQLQSALKEYERPIVIFIVAVLILALVYIIIKNKIAKKRHAD